MGQPREVLGVDSLKVFRVCDRQVNQIVGVARHQMTRHHLGARQHRSLERGDVLHGLARQRDLDKNVERPVDQIWVQHGNVPLNNAGTFQRLDPSMASRGRQANTLGDVRGGLPAVVLEFAENQAVNGIDVIHAQIVRHSPARRNKLANNHR